MPQDIFKVRSTKTTASGTSIQTRKSEKPTAGPAKPAEKPVDLKQRIQELETELKTATATAEEFKAQLETMINAAPQSLDEDASRHIIDLEQRLFEANQQLEQLAVAQNKADADPGAKERIANLEFDLEYAKEAQNTIRQELDRVQGELKAAQEQLAQAQAAQPQADDGTVKELQEKLAGAYSKAAEAQSQITDIEMTADERVAKAQEELTQFQIAADEANRQNIDTFNAAMAEANTKVQEMEGKVTELEARLAKPAQDLADARRHAAEALIEKDRVVAAAQDALTAAEEQHKQSMAKERKLTNHVAFFAISAFLLLLVTFSLLAYRTYLSNLGVVNGPAQTFLGHKPQATPAKTPSMITLPMDGRNLKRLFGLADPGCIKGKIGPTPPNVMSINTINCKGGEPVYSASQDCTDVRGCGINFPAWMADGGSFPATVDNLYALTGQSDPTCYVTNRLSVWGKGKNQLHFECGQYIKDTVRDCWNVSTCRIEVPKNLDK